VIGPPEQHIENQSLKEDLLENIKAGNFYTVVRSPDFTSGREPPGNGFPDIGPALKIRTYPGIVNMQTGQMSMAIHVETDLPSTISFIPGYLCQKTGTVQSDVGTSETYFSVGHEDYIRVEVLQKRADGELYLAISQPLFIRKYFSIQSWNYPSHLIRHKNFLGELSTPTFLDLRFWQDSSFRLVPGLADAHADLVSFESINYKGYYLRHQDYRLKLQPMTDVDLFRRDATFRMKPGLADPSCISFEPYNFPGFYIRHRDYHLYIEREDSELFRKDATFRLVDPACKSMVLCPE
jgi:hypothetical protein